MPLATLAGLAITAAAAAAAASAATITGVSIEEFSSELNANRLATNIIDGTGFDEANGFHGKGRRKDRL